MNYRIAIVDDRSEDAVFVQNILNRWAMERRLIRVYMDMKGTQLYISFTNFTSGRKLKKVGNLFKTSKGEGHGFGLVRIDAIVERLEGYLSRNSEDGAFTTEILLP